MALFRLPRLAASFARSLSPGTTRLIDLCTTSPFDHHQDRRSRSFSLVCSCVAQHDGQHLASSSAHFASPLRPYATADSMHCHLRRASSASVISLNNLSPGRRKDRKRRARGGGDKTAGRGMNGQKSRRGTGSPALFFEGGQTPMWKRLPKRGFYNRFAYTYNPLHLNKLDVAIRAGKLDPSRVITSKHIYDAGLIDKKAYNRNGVALIGAGNNFEIPIDIEVARVTENAKEAIESAGGKVTRVYYNQLGMRALLLPDWFAKKGRLLPRAVQMVPYKKQWRYDRVGALPPPDAPAFGDCPQLMELAATG